MELVNILASVPLCSGLSPDQLASLTAISHRETYNTDATIFSQNHPGDKMYIITRGQVEIRLNDGSGGNHATLYLGQGQLFGEMALLDQGTRSASVVAVEDGTEVYAIRASDFLALCQQDTAIGFIVMRNMALDLSFKLRHKNLDPSASI
ncbi:MAG: cyclic nucleotide-binding domain-containing protein [Chloroflexi bacterium]|nr:cyclic nucleotide-binding domain-containing protein [Chloroflexota bacterium]MCC6892317.1 cyclic nucleotide-binding domain-containing protein [Anaerolineae bacterium]